MLPKTETALKTSVFKAVCCYQEFKMESFKIQNIQSRITKIVVVFSI